jgi:hypothetical protein
MSARATHTPAGGMTALGMEVIPIDSQSAKRVGALSSQPRQSSPSRWRSATSFPVVANGSSRSDSARAPKHPGRRGVDGRAATCAAASRVLGSPQIKTRSMLARQATHTPRQGQKPSDAIRRTHSQRPVKKTAAKSGGTAL